MILSLPVPDPRKEAAKEFIVRFYILRKFVDDGDEVGVGDLSTSMTSSIK